MSSWTRTRNIGIGMVAAATTFVHVLAGGGVAHAAQTTVIIDQGCAVSAAAALNIGAADEQNLAVQTAGRDAIESGATGHDGVQARSASNGSLEGASASRGAMEHAACGS